MNNETFEVYSDESGIFDERYQAIGVVSGQGGELSKLRKILNEILTEESVSDLKFVKILRGKSKTSKAARRFITCTVKDFAIKRKTRIDVIIWDSENPYNVMQRSVRTAMLEDMYHRILTHIGRQWKQSSWNFYPDINSQIPWDEIVSFLNRTSLVRSKPRLLQLIENSDSNQSFNFSSVKELSSSCEPLIQLADLFAGMARFSREEGEQCIQWLNSWGNRAQLKFHELLSDSGHGWNDVNRTRRARFEMIGSFDRLCKRHKMRVSLRTNKCLYTFDPAYPVNFWNC